MPFNPTYMITDKILNNITAISSAREVIEQAYLTPKWEAKLRRQALLHNAYTSTALVGNKLTFKEAEALYTKRNKKCGPSRPSQRPHFKYALREAVCQGF